MNRLAEAVTESRIEAQPITPWAPQPVERVAMRQTWRNLTFLHWRYEPGVVARLLPPGLQLDTFDGAAYVGLIPFEIHNLRGIPHFPETNVRTYVIGPDGSRAVWFFSLDAARLLAVIGARVAYHLPYFWAKMHVRAEDGKVCYTSRRKWPHSVRHFADIVIKPEDRRPRSWQGTALPHVDFLTARYRLYALNGRRLAYAQIEHDPWPLTRATVIKLDQNLIEAAGLPTPQGAPLVDYAAELNVRIGYIGLC
ncbi:MAG TPA: DUF2071 domain-containing protein [Bryobacteraceae bacterium]|nr:DUF2071 domain-containing protein [Bryobacteraceae bacterium]